MKNFCSQLLLAVLCRVAETIIHAAATEKAAVVMRICKVVYLLNVMGFSCVVIDDEWLEILI